MNRSLFRVGALLLLSGIGRATVPADYDWSKTALTISIEAPPALLYVTDLAGRRTGLDPSGGLTKVGFGSKWEEIPLSQCHGENIRNDESGEASPRTVWQVGILDSGPQTFVIHVIGVEPGVTTVHVGMVFDIQSGLPDLPSIETPFVVSPGVERDLNLRFDPDHRVLTSSRIITPGDLAADVRASCSATLIEPSGICQSLEAKADAAGTAAGRGNTNALRGAIWAFLGELKAQTSKHVQEPAATVLKEEAESLLVLKPRAAKAATRAKAPPKRPGKN